MSNTFSRVTKSRRAALAGGAAVVLTAAAAHAVFAQQTAGAQDAQNVPSPVPPDRQDTLFYMNGPGADINQRRNDWINAVARKLGVSTDKLQQAITEADKDIGPMPVAVGAMPGTFQLAVQSPFASAAKALNIDEQQLRKEQAAGKSLNDIARAHNMDPRVVADALIAQRKAELDNAVANGLMTQAIADNLMANVADEIDHLMQAVPIVGGDGRGVSIRLEWMPAR
jgi:hypothetical protein